MRGLGKIKLATLNIRSGRVGGLEAALRSLRQVSVDVGVLKGTKLTEGIHACHGEGYYVWEIQE